ncbi:MAG: hypothetical protein QM696_08650 [Steroidobacteraceae bacterium]
MSKGTKVRVPDKSGTPLNVLQAEGESPDAALAKMTLQPSAQAALTLQRFGVLGAQQDPNAIASELQGQAKAANGNDLSRLEAMLTIQAHTLDAIFNDMARRAHLNMGAYPQAVDRYMRLALKAQSQCRATVESLAEIKNPKPVAFVHQANIANGPQQVNNGVAPDASRERAGNSNPSNEILESIAHGNRLEQGTAGAGIAGDSTLATMGQGNRTKVARGQG